MGDMADLWSAFEHDPRDPAYAPMRAADRDRDVILHALAEAYAEGRLTREEYDERSDQVTSARTLGELPPVVADLLPATALDVRASAATAKTDPRQRAVEKYRRDRHESLWAFLMASAVCWGIWLGNNWGEGPHGVPWPAWVSLVTGLNVGRVLFQRQFIIDTETQRLEKKAERARRKELEAPSDDDS
jgi:hypothetical protein